MTLRRMATVDAQTYWMSAKIPNDAFLLYGFAGVPSDIQQALGEVRERARGCPELRLRVQDRSALTYPAWVPGEVDARQFVVHDLDDNGWSGFWPRSAGWPTISSTPAQWPGGCMFSRRSTACRAQRVRGRWRCCRPCTRWATASGPLHWRR